ncbi:MAG: protein kinase [Gemmatimonadota bacterium]|nr:protein kinase [Gemmatimonadota bacterium]
MANELQNQLQGILGEGYRVDRELGGAGMSRVFLVQDLELDRQVVVKVLPPDLAAGLNVDRFRREIQLAAKLQHPHIVPLLSAGAKGGLLYYTMPFIAGENLRARLMRLRELPVSDATRILREIADALESAHSQGVVHRDIKPENILFSGSHALVTDFGVSKALSSATAESRIDGTPNLTSLGIALGTPAYMAPEQAAADPNVDHRADIYSLGVVGYELLAGRPPFTGMSPQMTLSAQVTQTPDPITNHRPNLSPALASAIMRCLEKHPSDRWQTAEELRTQLETIFTPSGVTQPVKVRAVFRWTPQRVMIAAAAAGVLVAAVFLSTIAFKKDDASFSIGVTHQVTSAPGVEITPAISPDGKMVAYVASSPTGRAQIFVRQISGGRAVPLTDGMTDAQFPRWKPDGSALLYLGHDGANYTIPPLGGSPSALISGSAPGPFGSCTWSPAGDRLACTSGRDGAIYVGDADGRNLKRITPTTRDLSHSPAWSPDGKRVAYVSGNSEFLMWGSTLGNLAGSSIWVVSAAGGDPQRITDENHLNTSPVWAADGEHILFVSSTGGARDIYSQRVRSSGKPDGAPARLTTGLNPHSISLSSDGHSLAYSVFTTTGNIWEAAINGTQPIQSSSMRQLTSGNQTIESMAVSRDEKWLAYDSNVNGNADIYRLSLDGGEPQQLTHDPADDFSPAWSPDGTQIAFHSFRNGNRDIFVMSADGSRVETVVATPRQERLASWSADGMSIAYVAMPDSVMVVSRGTAGWGKPRFLARGGAPLWSPDGNWIAVSIAGDINLDGGVLLIHPDGSGGRTVPLKGHSALAIFGGVWSTDSRLFYYCGTVQDGTWFIGVVDFASGATKQLYHFADPLRQPYRGVIWVDSKNLFYTIGTRESDVWVMELNRR